MHSCELVQDVLLKHVDAAFSFQLTHEHEVHSVVYLVRWLRLLFLREFTLTQALSVWDVIFARARVNTCLSLPNDTNDSTANGVVGTILNITYYNDTNDIVIKPVISFIVWFATAMLLTLRGVMIDM